VGLVAVVPGDGLARIFRSLGTSQIVLGGQRPNPSPQDLLDAVRQAPAEAVLILPNNRNIMLAAGQVQKLSDKTVKVLSTETVPQGIAALLTFNDQADVDTNHRAMTEAARQVRTIEVARAGRDTSINGFEIKRGEVVGWLDNEVVSVQPDYDGAVLDIAVKIDIEMYDIFTLYFGRECSSAQAEVLAEKVSRLYPELEIELHRGGQPHYHYIISLE
jgi:dihydroxyacetone kinase-like predicted kinase